MMFYAEQTDMTFNTTYQVWTNSDGTVSSFQSVVHTFWWCIVTVTTVGYGDIFPHSVLGKIVAGFAMILGIVMLAFPLTIISSTFSEIYGNKKKKDEELRQLAQKENGTPFKTKYELVDNMYENLFSFEGKIGTVSEDLDKMKQDLVSMRISMDLLKRGEDETYSEGVQLDE